MSDITIRNATLADAPRILEIYAYYVEHTVITFEYDVPSLAEFEDRMRAIMQKYPYLVIERDGRIEGYTYAHAFVGRAAYDWAAELTISTTTPGAADWAASSMRRWPTGSKPWVSSTSTPASATRRWRTNTSPKTAPSSTNIWASRWPVPSTTAAISSGAGTT